VKNADMTELHRLINAGKFDWQLFQDDFAVRQNGFFGEGRCFAGEYVNQFTRP
jgi:hypothetical protein